MEEEIYEEYGRKLEEHIKNVQIACRMLGVPEEQTKIHDQSKYGEEEFKPYAKWFYSDEKNPSEFEKAWLHHIHHNPHHWQYWVVPTRYSLEGSTSRNGVLEMPGNYALEMVADWMGSNKTYKGSWDMTEWLEENMEHIIVHPNTAYFLREILYTLGYQFVWDTNFCEETEEERKAQRLHYLTTSDIFRY